MRKIDQRSKINFEGSSEPQSTLVDTAPNSDGGRGGEREKGAEPGRGEGVAEGGEEHYPFLLVA